MKTLGRSLLAALPVVGFISSSACGARSDLQGATSAGGAPSSSSSASSSTTTSSSSTSSSGGLCNTDAQCDDGVACTKDTCQPTGCVHALDDAACDDGIPCTHDACQPAGCVHTPDAGLCSDGKVCTVDTCVPGIGCQHAHTDAACDDGIACTTDTCDDATDTCRHTPCDNLCDDGVFCNGVERCDTTHGCTQGPPACGLGLSCSADSCHEAAQQCSHVQPSGCAPSIRLLVCDGLGALFSVSPFGGPTQMIAPSNGTTHFDVAILGSRWFAIDPSPQQIAELHPFTNQVKHAFPAPPANSLGAGPDGKLYAASTEVFRIDPDTGATAVLGELPPGYQSSGDIAFLGNRMFVSADGPCGGALVEFDPATGKSILRGGDGLGCVYGLASTGGTLFIVNCNGTVGTFDPVTGVARLLSTTGADVDGADVLP